MQQTDQKTRYRWNFLVITLCLAAPVSLVYADKNSPGAINEFLSDPQRVGSLSGIVIGGALTAHPAGAVAGSLIGFFVGKQTKFKNSEKQRQAQINYAQRSIIPTTSRAIKQQTIAFNSGNTYSTQQSSTSLQIAAHCYGNQHYGMDARLQAMCYYHQSN